MTDHRPVLCGMNNPVSSRPEHALFPYPPGCTGHRIWMMLNLRVDATRHEYLDAFDRRNLLGKKTWNRLEARLGASVFLESVRNTGRTIVVLGEQPRQLLELERVLIEPREKYGCTWRQIPHPSGRCHWYNDPANQQLAAVLLEELYEDWRRRCPATT